MFLAFSVGCEKSPDGEAAHADPNGASTERIDVDVAPEEIREQIAVRTQKLVETIGKMAPTERLRTVKERKGGGSGDVVELMSEASVLDPCVMKLRSGLTRTEDVGVTAVQPKYEMRVRECVVDLRTATLAEGHTERVPDGDIAYWLVVLSGGGGNVANDFKCRMGHTTSWTDKTPTLASTEKPVMVLQGTNEQAGRDVVDILKKLAVFCRALGEGAASVR